jgi:hypothetical protein
VHFKVSIVACSGKREYSFRLVLGSVCTLRDADALPRTTTGSAVSHHDAQLRMYDLRSNTHFRPCKSTLKQVTEI